MPPVALPPSPPPLRAAAVAAPSPVLPARRSFAGAAERTARWAADRPGLVRFSIRVGGRVHGRRAAETTSANSLVKVSILAADLRRTGARERPRTAAERRRDSVMIRRSDNDAATVLVRRLGLEPLRAVGRAAGDRGFRPSPAPFWARSRVTAAGQARLFERLPALLPARHRDYALGLLRTIKPSQRWGLWRAAPAGWPIAAKAGWNDRGHVVQAARLDCGSTTISLAVFVDARSQHAGELLVEQTGRRLLAPLLARGDGACPPGAP